MQANRILCLNKLLPFFTIQMAKFMGGGGSDKNRLIAEMLFRFIFQLTNFYPIR